MYSKVNPLYIYPKKTYRYLGFLTEQVLEFSFPLVKVDTAMLTDIIPSLRMVFRSTFVFPKIEMFAH